MLHQQAAYRAPEEGCHITTDNLKQFPIVNTEQRSSLQIPHIENLRTKT